MTGYGKAEALLEGGKLTVEIRCINGKNADISVKSSLLPKDREMQVRKLLAERLQRGTVDMFLTWEPLVRQAAAGINTELAASYFAQLQELGGRLPLPDLGDEDSPARVLGLLLALPDVVESRKRDVICEQDWPQVERAVVCAIDAVEAYRRREGEALAADMTARVQT
ncbi:MAG: hypothetical protein J5871_06060, partial [Bacteroidales bacterium]|nr:hypothetical protein [Bacteroidales bacterium]